MNWFLCREHPGQCVRQGGTYKCERVTMATGEWISSGSVLTEVSSSAGHKLPLPDLHRGRVGIRPVWRCVWRSAFHSRTWIGLRISSDNCWTFLFSRYRCSSEDWPAGGDQDHWQAKVSYKARSATQKRSVHFAGVFLFTSKYLESIENHLLATNYFKFRLSSAEYKPSWCGELGQDVWDTRKGNWL